jgi:hypothetical protein
VLAWCNLDASSQNKFWCIIYRFHLSYRPSCLCRCCRAASYAPQSQHHACHGYRWFRFTLPPLDLRLSLRRALDTISTCTLSKSTQSEPIDTPEHEDTLEELLTRWQTDLVRTGHVPTYLIHVLPSLQAVEDTKDQRPSGTLPCMQEHDLSLPKELVNSCLNTGCRIFLSSCRRPREPTRDLEETS